MNQSKPQPHDADDDPFRPPAIPTDVQCLHCGREYGSYLIEFVPNDDSPYGGDWRCPTPGCSGVGFGFDILPADPEWTDECGHRGWCGDDEDEFAGGDDPMDALLGEDDGLSDDDGDGQPWDDPFEEALGLDDHTEADEEEYDPAEPKYKDDFLARDEGERETFDRLWENITGGPDAQNGAGPSQDLPPFDDDDIPF